MQQPYLSLLRTSALVIVLSFGSSSYAGITVQEGITPVSAWPESVDISTGDPALSATVASVTATHIISQSFTPATTTNLGAIYLSYSTSAASTSGSFSIRLQAVSKGNPTQTYTQGTNLLPSSSFTFSLASTGGATRLLKLSCTGADQITLNAGTVYVLEVISSSSTVFLYRRAADLYAGGAVFDNRSAINYPSTRDIAMAIKGTAPSGGDTVAPTVPTGLAATAASTSQINLSWNASTDNVGVTGYDIYRGGVYIASAAGTSYSDTGLAAAATYAYTVSAYDAADNTSAQSASVSATTQSAGGGGSIVVEEGITPASAWPTSVTISAGDPGLSTVGVQVKSNTIVSQTFTPATNFNLGAIYFSYSTTAASAANGFTLRIQSVTGGSSVQTYTVGSDLLGATPVTFSLANTGGAISLLKFEFSGGYQIPLTQGTTYSVEVISSGSIANFYRRGAESYTGGALYTNRSALNYPSTRDIAMAVVAASGGGGSDTTAPSVPSGLAATAVSSGQINLSWTASTDNVGVTGYKIYRNGSQIASSGSTSYSNIGLSPSTAYSYTVQAYDAAGNNSAQSSSASATTLAGGGPVTKIFPLGDSITDGFLIPGAYRINLEPALQNAGISFNFVGSRQNGPAELSDKDHEGHSGWRIEEISAGIAQWGWVNTFQPDIVLLMIGANDVIQDYQVATAPDRLIALIDQIHTIRPGAMVLVSNLVTIGPNYLARLNTYNAAIKPLILAKVQNRELVRFVEQNEGSLWGETYDGVHPNAAGYVKISNRWFQAIIAHREGWIPRDIGTTAIGGSTTITPSSGTFTASGSGAGIAGTMDAFHFIHRDQKMVGDGSITARVNSMQNTNTAAKAGVMIRETGDANAKFAAMAVTPTAGGWFGWRATAGSSASSTTVSGLAAPRWVRLVRTGNTFTTYYSTDGSNWTQAGSQTITMGTNVEVGLAVTSSNDGVLCPANFSNVTVQP